MIADSPIQSRLLIPEEWANRTRCPVCSSVFLSLKRSLDGPDQLACDGCHTHFEISQDGILVRVMIPPPGLPIELVGEWVDPEVVALRGGTAAARAIAEVENDLARETILDTSVINAAPQKQDGYRSWNIWAVVSIVSLLVIAAAVVVGVVLTQ
jgi:hypothetical protein